MLIEITKQLDKGLEFFGVAVEPYPPGTVVDMLGGPADQLIRLKLAEPWQNPGDRGSGETGGAAAPVAASSTPHSPEPSALEVEADTEGLSQRETEIVEAAAEMIREDRDLTGAGRPELPALNRRLPGLDGKVTGDELAALMGRITVVKEA